MDLKHKIIFTVLFLVAVPLWFFIHKFNNRNLKNGLLKKNPNLVESANWFFSKKKEKFIIRLMVIMILIFLLMMWFDVVIIPVEK